MTRSLSKISTPWNLACAIAASFSGSVPLTDTVAIDLRIRDPLLAWDQWHGFGQTAPALPVVRRSPAGPRRTTGPAVRQAAG